MRALVSAIVLVALLAGPAGAQSVYQSSDDPVYQVFEVNAQTEAHPATTWSEHATQWIASLAAKFGVSSTQQITQGTPVSIGF